jgi:ribosomal protein S6--L-glutamate ligase
MILSFHPCFVGDQNIICAGRDPDARDLAWIKKADAVILPQGCHKSLYEMAADQCRHVFPDYKARFSFPGKIGQARLFKQVNAPFPETHSFLSLAEFDKFRSQTNNTPGLTFPFVFKFDWGGESDNVLLIESKNQLIEALRRAVEYEKTGQSGFLIQEFIPSANRSLRVAAIGTKRISYWRVQPDQNNFSTGVSKGAFIDKASDTHLQQAGIDMVDRFCDQTDINLAGFDIVFSDKSKPRGYFLEINYFFGRTGIGGSEKFYKMLNHEINLWLKRIGLTGSVSLH